MTADRIGLSTELATEQFDRVWSDADLLRNIGPALTCCEAEALADMLQASGVAVATITDALLKSHIDSDDPGEHDENT